MTKTQINNVILELNWCANCQLILILLINHRIHLNVNILYIERYRYFPSTIQLHRKETS